MTEATSTNTGRHDSLVRSKPGPSKFQELLTTRAAAAATWLVRSIDACDGQGSAVYYSRWFRPRRGWMWPYPETTGYIIPTLLRYARVAHESRFTDVALRQADWILSLQYANGALPGTHVERGRIGPPSIFNTGQMILGLVAAADETGDTKFLAAAARAARWLADEVDTNTGVWKSHGYVSDYSPAYYTRVCWPMLEVDARAPDATVRSRAAQVLDTILSWRLPNGAFHNWGFKKDTPAFTHTIAYTIRGLLESARLLGDEGECFAKAAVRSAEVFRRKLELRGGLAGAYDTELRGHAWYVCLTGNCQMALIWMKLYESRGDARFLSAALKALQFVLDRQRIHTLDPNVRGAIAGSSPFWGRYLTLRYPNWAAKFFLDAVMAAHDHLGELLERGPCASR